MASRASVRQTLGEHTPDALWHFRNFWFIGISVVAFVAPGLLALGREVWSTEQGAQGPIILATGLWLLWRESRGMQMRQAKGRTILAIGSIVVIGAIYIFASIISKLWLQWACASVCLLCVVYAYIGIAAMRRLWFPFLYLAFLIPPPDGIIVPLTRALKLTVASTAINILSVGGYEVAFNGAQLYIDSYELVVAAACSGLNSLSSLLAIGLFYIFLRHRANWRYSFVLAAFVIPIAVLTNIVRVMILLLVTHYFGPDASQGLLHEAAGMMMFFIALFALIGVDALASPLRDRLDARTIGSARHG